MNTTERVIREQFPFWAKAPTPVPMASAAVIWTWSM